MATSSGFGPSASLRNAFARHLHTSPQAYRAAFPHEHAGSPAVASFHRGPAYQRVWVRFPVPGPVDSPGRGGITGGRQTNLRGEEPMTEFKQGDRVTWSSHGGTADGEVVRKITEDTEAGGRTVRASQDEPQYLVRSDNGGEAVHKPEALKKS